MKLDELILAKCKENPEAAALHFEGIDFSRGAFAELVAACRTRLEAAGFPKGARVVTLLPNCPVLLATAVALWQLGGSICPLTTVLGPQTLVGALKMLDPWAILTTEEGAANEALAAACGPRLTVVHPAMPLPELRSQTTRLDEKPYAVIFATSGTTGAPKAVPLTHENIADNIFATAEHVSLEKEGLKVLNVLPNHHTFGFCLSGILPLVLGYSQLMLPHFLPPKRVLDALYHKEISVIIAVPTLYGMLSEGILKAGLPHPPHLKRLICGGAATPARVYERALQALGVPIHEGYGLTECSPVVASVHRPEEGRAGTIGPFLPRFQHQLRDLDGAVVEGNEGVLWVKGPSVCEGYYMNPEADRDRFDDGWFCTGDVVRLCDDGTMQILDRSNDIIIVSGFNVYPQEVENLILTYPGVAECAVVGAPNAISGEIPVAYIVPSTPDFDEKALQSWLKERMTGYKTPRKIKVVQELPHNPLGKVLRRVLRDAERAARGK